MMHFEIDRLMGLVQFELTQLSLAVVQLGVLAWYFS